jgi:Flp pilus assembly protein TadG
MIPNNILKLVAVAFLSSVLFSVETTSDFKGKVTDNFGNALSDAEITITNTSTNRSSSTSANESGNFVLSNLPVGGPYTVLVRSSAGSQRYTDVYLNLGQTLSLNVVLTDFEQLVVTGDQILGSQVALGPSKVFDTAEILKKC